MHFQTSSCGRSIIVVTGLAARMNNPQGYRNRSYDAWPKGRDSVPLWLTSSLKLAILHEEHASRRATR